MSPSLALLLGYNPQACFVLYLPQDIVISCVVNTQGILQLSALWRPSSEEMLTWPPATTGTKALVSAPWTLNWYSKNEHRSFSIENVWRIDSVKALPDACPSCRRCTTSFSLLNALISLRIGFNGLTLRWSTTFFNFSDATVGPYRYRCNDDLDPSNAGISE